jgi:hypothetical protein
MGHMITRRTLGAAILLALGACGSDGPGQPGPVPAALALFDGNGQIATVGNPLPDSLRVRATDATGEPVSGVTVGWSITLGAGSVSPSSSTTNSDGVASTLFTLSVIQGEQRAQAAVNGAAGSPVVFSATANPRPNSVLSVVGGGNNVPERYSSDLWVHGNYAYTGTWGGFNRAFDAGDVLKVWALDAAGAPGLVDSVKVPGISTVSDVEVSADGQLLLFSTEFGENAGLFVYSLTDPAHPVFQDSALTPRGIHTASLGVINGRQYAFAARDPGFGTDPAQDDPALLIYDVTAPTNMVLTATVPVPPTYGIHDTYVRDGLVFVFAWDAGVIIYDVGNGMSGGSPSNPVEISRLVTAVNNAGTPAVHNGWWFHNPVTQERRYLFIGQEGPGVIGAQSSGDIHVVDVSDLAHPQEVAFFHLNGAGTHNFWVDEAKQILYAAYYNGGIIALDISGTLSGNLSGRLLNQVRPGGNGNTYTWGVQSANGSLYAIDMLTGLWQLRTE